MTRLTDQILGNKAHNTNGTRTMTDLTYGGQHGYANVPKEWLGNKAYVQHQVKGIALEAPGFFSYMPNPDKLREIYRAVIETQCRKVEGLNAGVNLTFDEHIIGGGGEMQQEIIDSKRDRTEPVLEFLERYGMPFNSFFDLWIRYGGMDPDAKYALVGTMDEHPSDMLPDQYTGTVLYYETDPLNREVWKSWLISNFMPQKTGEVVGRMDKSAPGELRVLSIPFTGWSIYNLGGNYLAQQIHNAIRLNQADPARRRAHVEEIAADLVSASRTYKTTVENIGENLVPAGA